MFEQLHGTVFDVKVQVQKELGHPVGEQQLFLLPVSSSSSGDQFLLELNNSRGGFGVYVGYRWSKIIVYFGA